jgi:hypothetical protein
MALHDDGVQRLVMTVSNFSKRSGFYPNRQQKAKSLQQKPAI